MSLYTGAFTLCVKNQKLPVVSQIALMDLPTNFIKLSVHGRIHL